MDIITGLESILAFTILLKDIKNGNITVSDINSDSDVKKLSVKDDDKELIKGTDYDVETKKDGNKTTVIITFKGNYTGTIERVYTIPENLKDSGSVKTGDNTQSGLLAILYMISAGCLTFLITIKRKRNS